MITAIEESRAATDQLWAAVESFDGEVADDLLDGLLRERSLSEAIMQVVLPFLAELGDRWEDGRLSVAHEHFVSNLLRRWLSAYTGRPRDPDAPVGPVVLLACPPGERHDLVLLCFSLLLGESGARTRFLGADTPMPAIVAAARAASADAVVIAATRDTALVADAPAISRLAVEHPVFVAGRGATQSVAEQLNAHHLPHDPVAAVHFLQTVLAT